MNDKNATEGEAESARDRWGHVIDRSVGYARGDILASSLEESKRRQHALRLVQKRALNKGPGSFYNFTGLHRGYVVEQGKLAYGEEWVGQAFFWEELVKLGREHLGGREEQDVAVFNRATAGIIATCLALSGVESIVLSVTPGSRSHPSIARGARLAGAALEEVSTVSAVERHLSLGGVSLVVITGVSSELEVMEESVLMRVVRMGREKGIPTFLDDAYGARLRPIIYGQPRSLETGVDIAITSCDKAGMGGPRAGLMAGRKEMIDRILARAGEMGLEARPPLALGVYTCLERFDANVLRREVELGERIYEQLSAHLGKERVKQAGLGATIPEEVAWDYVRCLRGKDASMAVVPAEITAAIGMYWLERYGIITVNALGQPGARVSLRFKPDPEEIERFGGIPALIRAIDDGFQYIAEMAGTIDEMKRLILGEQVLG